MQSARDDKAGTLVIVSLTTLWACRDENRKYSSLPLATTHLLSAVVTRTVVESPGQDKDSLVCDACRG